jgi:hypothetical protein
MVDDKVPLSSILQKFVVLEVLVLACAAIAQFLVILGGNAWRLTQQVSGRPRRRLCRPGSRGCRSLSITAQDCGGKLQPSFSTARITCRALWAIAGFVLR